MSRFDPLQRWLRAGSAVVSLLALGACAGLGDGRGAPALDAQAAVPAGYLIDANAFAKRADAPRPAPGFVPQSVSRPGPFSARVILYDSPTTRSYLERGGIEASHRVVAWEGFLRRYRIPFRTVSDPALIDASPAAVLLLPSSVALTDRERQSIVDFRGRGGSVLVTWAAGVRNERGDWVGFDFMKQSLDTEVVGTTAGEKDDVFLMPQGDGPASHSLPAGHRIWTERVAQWWPLRLTARNPSLHIMDWSRNFHDKRATVVAHYDERVYPGSAHSRVVALGLPERLLNSVDPKLFDAVLHDSLGWLLRLPRANTAAWPAGLESALLFAVNGVEIFNDADVSFMKHLDEAGVRATIYALGDNARRSAARLQDLIGRGHELAVMGDKFAGFRDQPAAQQLSRMDSALARLTEAGLSLPQRPGFHAPTESYDRNTERLIRDRHFGHFIALQDIAEARTPVVLPAVAGAAGDGQPIVAFPRSQRGPEDATEEGDVEEGLKSFYAEFALSVRMRGLAVVRIPNQGLLPLENLAEVAAELRTYRGRIWMATASELAGWWLERERLRAHVEGEIDRPVLSVTLEGDGPLRQPVTVLVHLPGSNTEVELLRDGQPDTRFRTWRIDAHRAGIEFKALESGTHRWTLRFRPPAAVKSAAATP